MPFPHFALLGLSIIVIVVRLHVCMRQICLSQNSSWQAHLESLLTRDAIIVGLSDWIGCQNDRDGPFSARKRRAGEHEWQIY